MPSQVCSRQPTVSALVLAFSGAFAGQASAAATPALMALGTSLGHEAPSAPLGLTVWLKLHDRAALDARVAALYDPLSPTYHQWLTDTDLQRYLPTEAELDAVRGQLQAAGLQVGAIDPYRLSLRVGGASARFESAFHTTINRLGLQGRVVLTSTAEPTLGGAAGSAFRALGGLDSAAAVPLIAFPGRTPTASAPVGRRTEIAAAAPAVPTSCFEPAATTTVSGLSATDQKTPASVTFSGLSLGNLADEQAGDLGCGYPPSSVRGFYGLSTFYRAGVTGRGQTIVIIDAYSQAQAKMDANVFSALFGLPALTSANYAVYAPEGAPEITGTLGGTDKETDLDVEWAHAIAPSAKIALLTTYGSEAADFQTCILYALSHHLGNVISISYGSPESEASRVSAEGNQAVDELAAAEGVSVQVSTGDTGDYSSGGVLPRSVNSFASSQYDTAVGGTAVGIFPGSTRPTTLGWGDTVNPLTEALGTVNYVATPPDRFAFAAGGGGGASQYFGKPAYQGALPGKARLLPDVSALADPFTGALFVYDVGGTTYETTVGGTSLAAPIFASIWALVDEAAGVALGQAAPYVAKAPSSLIRDVTPVSGPAQPTAQVTENGKTTLYSADVLAGPAASGPFTAAIYYDHPGSEWWDLILGADSSLTVTKGWDDVTGYGTPDFGGLSAGSLAASR